MSERFGERASANASSVSPAGFCERCGRPAERRVPAGDNRARRVCTGCGHIHYENPKNVVGCLLEWQGRVLLCRRAIEPRHGFWTLPAGFMENGESTVEGAAREAYEEAMARCDGLRLFALYNLPRISQVYLMFHGRLRDGFARAGEETLEVRLCAAEEIPWDELAFPVVTETLARWLETRDGHGVPDGGRDEARADDPGGGRGDPRHARRVHCADIGSRPGAPLEIVRHPF